MDAQQIGFLGPAILPPAARQVLGLGSAQTGDKIFAQLAFGNGADADALLGDATLGFIAPHELECAFYLHGRPSSIKKVVDYTKEHRVGGELKVFAAFETSAPGSQTGLSGVICLRCIGQRRRSIWPRVKTIGFADDARSRTEQCTRDLWHRAFVCLHHHDRRPLFRSQIFVVCAYRCTLAFGC